MPRSSKAPPLPPEPDINEVIQNDVARIKRLLGLDVNRLALGSEVEGIVIGGMFGSNDYTVTGANTIEFVNVSTSLGPSQGGSGFPAQVTGLTVTPHAGSDTQLDLAWTAITAPDFNYYNVYRGVTSGFTVDSSSEIAQPVTNSYQNTGLTAGTTYYYRVSVTNDAELEGTPSSQVSGTTTGTAPIPPMLDLHLDSDFIDSSAYGNVAVNIINSNGFVTPGAFGSAGWRCNTPTLTNPPPDGFEVPSQPILQMDTTVGFSLSFWVYPTNISALAKLRVVMEKYDSAGNQWTIQLNSAGTMYFFVKKGGVEYKAEKTGFTTGSWQHVAATFNGSTNTPIIYRAAVAGTSSSASTVTYTTNNTTLHLGFGNWGGSSDNHYDGYYDEVKYYKSVVLTPTQVTNLKNTNST